MSMESPRTSPAVDYAAAKIEILVSPELIEGGRVQFPEEDVPTLLLEASPHIQAPQPQLPLPHYPGETSVRDLTPSQQKRDVRTKFRRTMYTAGILASLAISRYISNTQEGKAEALASTPAISYVLESDNPAAADTMVVDFDGLSGRDAHDAASAEVAYKSIGDVYAIKYGNNVDAAPIAHVIIDQAERSGKKSVVLSGRSMGGIVAINTAIEVLEQSKGSISIPYIILDSSPSSIDSVWPDKLTYVDYISLVLAIFPDIEYSSDANFLGQYAAQLIAHPAELLNKDILTTFVDAANYYQAVNSDKKARPYLINSEYNAIIAGDVESKLTELSELTGENKPIIVLMQAVETDPESKQQVSADTTINSAVSAKEYTEFADKAKLPLIIVHVPGTVHANPGYRPAEWNAGVATQVLPAIEDHQSQIAVTKELTTLLAATANTIREHTIGTTEDNTKVVAQAAPAPPSQPTG